MLIRIKIQVVPRDSVGKLVKELFVMQFSGLDHNTVKCLLYCEEYFLYVTLANSWKVQF